MNDPLYTPLPKDPYSVTTDVPQSQSDGLGDTGTCFPEEAEEKMITRVLGGSKDTVGFLWR